MKTFAWVLFIVVLGGIVWYGFARTVLLVLLIGSGLFIGSATALGVWEAASKRRAVIPSRRGRVLAQAASLADIKGRNDIELAELRRLAGLDK